MPAGKITDYLPITSSGASSAAGRTRSRAGGPLQHQHDQQQQDHHRQQHDVRAMLDLALFNLSRAQLGDIACELHPTSRAHRSLALSATPHLSLSGMMTMITQPVRLCIGAHGIMGASFWR
jgi:hypothetical protein